MRHTENFLSCNASSSIDNKLDVSRLYYQYWMPEHSPKALLLLIHGLGEHSSRYHPMANYFVERGFGVYALDHKGHGKSNGTAGFIDRFSDYQDGVSALFNVIKQEHPQIPVFLVGHSMGGLISAQFLLHHQVCFSGCILSAPAIIPADDPTTLQQVIIKLLSQYLPRLGVIRLDANGVSRDPEVVENYISDPLVYHGKLSARLAYELFTAMDTLIANAESIVIPMLIMHGKADSLAAVEGSELLHNRIGSIDKSLLLYNNLFHEIFNEPEQGQVFADMEKWLELHLQDIDLNPAVIDH